MPEHGDDSMSQQQIDAQDIDLWSTPCGDYTPDLKTHLHSCSRCQDILVERSKGPFISLRELEEQKVLGWEDGHDKSD